MNEQFGNIGELADMIGKLDQAEIRPVEVSPTGTTPEYLAIWNTSQNVLETITERKNSNLIQHHEAFTPFVEAMKAKNTEITGTLKNHGGEVIIEALFKDLYTGEGEDKIQLGARMVNNYSTRSGPFFKGEFFGFREFCDNGMILGKVLVGSVLTKHAKVSDLQKKMLEFVGNIFENAIKLQEIIDEADKEILDDDEADSILMRQFRRKKFVKKLKELFEERDLTRYTVYNAITKYATFQAKNEAQRERLQQIAQRILITPKSRLIKEEE